MLITSIQEIVRPNEACSGSEKGTLFSTLQATEHAMHPVHLSRSITIVHLAIVCSPLATVSIGGLAVCANHALYTFTLVVNLAGSPLKPSSAISKIEFGFTPIFLAHPPSALWPNPKGTLISSGIAPA